MIGAARYELPLWTAAPFVVLLLGIALLPLVAGHWWERHRNKFLFALACGAPAAICVWLQADAAHVAFGQGHPVFDALKDYVSFILLLFALFAISGGIYVTGTLAGTPLVNTAILTVGALLASLVGTTGASMLLIRPLLRANAVRRRKAHVVVFFTFIVSNCGGLLTPLGDPPLFLGFLHGVPFTWTLGLWKQWAVVNGGLLVIFQFVDSWFFHREDIEEAVGDEKKSQTDLDVEVERARRPLGVEGGFNVLLLAGVVAAIYCAGQYAWEFGVQETAMLGLAVVSLVTTAKETRAKNHFSYGPIVEVAVLFLGIFLAMVPALHLLNQHGGELPVASAKGFFWASGTLSSFLDNAPTYLTLGSVAAGRVEPPIPTDGAYLAELLARPEGPLWLAAIACGSVMMGANTYIGNGPNFMVKAIAESAGVKMPSFFGYMRWSFAVLIPLFVIVTIVFF